MKQLLISLFLLSTPTFAKEGLLYGEDGRFEIDSFNAFAYRNMAKAVAGKVKKSLIIEKNDKYVFSHLNLIMSGVSSKVPFSRQQVLTDCTGFLVAPDVMVTAGHCIKDQKDCESSLWVFDYNLKMASKKYFKKENSATCKEILDRQFDEDKVIDYSVIRLNEKFIDREPLKFRTQGEIQEGEPVVMLGHPLGVPMKLAKGANVWHTKEEWTFSANLDAFGGNSGSPVINESTGLVEGILVRGITDFHELDDGKLMVNLCEENSDEEVCHFGEDITRIKKLNLQKYLEK